MPAVTFGDESLDLADLVLLGLHLGSWSEFEANVRRGLALSKLDLDPVPRETIKASATRFRYERGLVSASDFTAWLKARELKVSDLSGVIERRFLREREAHRPPAGQSPDIGPVLWAEATCLGMLRSLSLGGGDRLAASFRVDPSELGPPDPEHVRKLVARAKPLDAAGLAQLPEAELAERAARVLTLDAAQDRLRAQVADERAIARCLASHVLEWLQIGGEELIVSSEGAAREVRMLLVEDGLGPAEAAERAHADISERRLTVDRAPADAGDVLVAAAPGEVAGPWLEGDRWRVMLIRHKSPPSADHPELRERAAQELLRDALDRALAGRVGWPMPL
jgi:hypothetical protein